MGVAAPTSRLAAVLAIAIVFWVCAGLIVWTHAAYGIVVAGLARLHRRRVAAADIVPNVLVVVAAYNEATVIERRLENLLALDYPAEKLTIVVSSDASTDATNDIVARIAEREPRVHLLVHERGGKIQAQDKAVRAFGADVEVLAFSDANCTWAPDALRLLVRPLADPSVGYVCGRLAILDADGINKEGAYWRYEMWLRANESAIGSVTGGNGSIYAVRRDAYIEVHPSMGHDLSFPYRMVQNGFRAVYEPAAVASEKPSKDTEEEYRRKVRMFEHCWLIVLRGKMLRRLPPLYWVAIVSHRHLRYLTGLLHLAALGANLALVVGDSGATIYWVTLAAQLGAGALALLGKARVRVPFAALAWYYTLISWATTKALVNYLRRGVPATWEAAQGTR
ncbi:MAG: glycosyltransferase [Actinobacteria bacterium]|nr:glycosyltransferase [Actinomycetota bacterium]